jgi:hypothetical protein
MENFNVWDENVLWAYVLGDLEPAHQQLFEEVLHQSLLLRAKVVAVKILAEKARQLPPVKSKPAAGAFEALWTKCLEAPAVPPAKRSRRPRLT